ncbi:clustered-asparagine-rich protein [Cardiosporidium cionae]|uniref:Clustered-asparagine-rich protein n=1 Tax=Cardiosporidium cionae TaxID=476202 RepID=A0ABQ7JBN9_9APIC|nr:clustered-asparagine-rich protein [Cardiosporidium cionae]|eukprot:KAF8821370.1 clustered-asparagine-rich protein [Cardiosporidium cionae]
MNLSALDGYSTGRYALACFALYNVKDFVQLEHTLVSQGMMASLDRKVWIGSIPSTVDETEFRDAMCQYGEVSELFYRRDTSGIRGWAFVTFATNEEATSAIRAVDGRLKFLVYKQSVYGCCTANFKVSWSRVYTQQTLHREFSTLSGSDRPVGARFANNKEMGGNKPPAPNSNSPLQMSASGSNLVGKLTSLGSGILGRARAIPSSSIGASTPLPSSSFTPPFLTNNSSFQNTNSANAPEEVYTKALWQQYTSPKGIPYYHNTITGHSQWQKPIPPKELMQGAIGRKVCGPLGSNLFIFHLPSEWTDIDLLIHFALFGNILSARVQANTSGKNFGFGFVSYDNNSSALAAITAMNGYSIGSKHLKVELKKGEEHHLPAEMQA